MSKVENLNVLVDFLGRYRSEGSNQYLFFCPSCKHHRQKLSINVEKNMFKCWICDYSGKSIFKLIKKFGSYKHRQEWSRLNNYIDLSDFSEQLFYEPSEDEDQENLVLPEEFISLANKKLPVSAAYALQYLRGRNITKKDIVKWKIGYCTSGEYENRVVVPSFGRDGTINYFVARSYSNNYQKYLNPSVSKDVVFNHLYIDWSSDLCLVEGVFDAIVAGTNSIPILGSILREDSRLFQEIVKNDTDVYVALDPDAETKAIKLIHSLLEYGVNVFKIDISPYKDVGEMSKEEFLKRKSKAEMINQTSLFMKTLFNS